MKIISGELALSMIVQDYLITEKTIALFPAKQIEYNTIIYEEHNTLLTKETTLELIEKACLNYGSTYDGRRKSVMHRTGYRRLVPIPISISRDIYAFPTHSPKHYECAWIFLDHIDFWKANRDSQETTIVFKNGKSLVVDVSEHVIQKQVQRTANCRFIFSDHSYLDL